MHRETALPGAAKHLPRDRKGLEQAVRDPKHPFTAAVLSALGLGAANVSGFGIFLVISWILGNLILTPGGIALIPVFVMVVRAHRRERLNARARATFDRLAALDRGLENGTVTRDEWTREYRRVIEGLLGGLPPAAACELLVTGRYGKREPITSLAEAVKRIDNQTPLACLFERAEDGDRSSERSPAGPGD